MRLPISLTVSSTGGRRSRRALRRHRDQLPAPTRREPMPATPSPRLTPSHVLEAAALPATTIAPLAGATVEAVPS
ncbi:MAG TPA: hypothetical protein VFN57_01625 [Thermomicrobiaceae bacterium]|nr:hypothetical protein [Thermomicrobiaceae bacterium]